MLVMRIGHLAVTFVEGRQKNGCTPIFYSTIMKEIKKRQYVKPQMAIYNVESPQLLAGSGNGETERLNEEDYEW